MQIKIKKSLLVIYPVVISLSVIFIFPFVWMLSTSLKPVEQTLQMPPQWLPVALYITIDNKKIRVKQEREITEPSYVVKITEGEYKGELVLVPESEYKDGKIKKEIQIADMIKEKYFRADIIQKVKPGFIKVIEKPEAEYFKEKPRWFCVPKEQITKKIKFEFENYKHAVTKIPFFKYALNTLIIAILGIIGVLISNAVVAYGFAKIDFPFKNLIFILTLATMMIPFPVTMIPLYSVFRTLRMTGTAMPLWVPAFFGSAFNIFLLRQFFMTIPNDLIESARIDGCSEIRILGKIIIPLAQPVLAVCALFHFLWVWNDFLGPLIYLTDENKFTLSLGLQFFQSQHGGTEWHLLMAASTLVILPIIILFFLTQKRFIEGITLTGMKF